MVRDCELTCCMTLQANGRHGCILHAVTESVCLMLHAGWCASLTVHCMVCLHAARCHDIIMHGICIVHHYELTCCMVASLSMTPQRSVQAARNVKRLLCALLSGHGSAVDLFAAKCTKLLVHPRPWQLCQGTDFRSCWGTESGCKQLCMAVHGTSSAQLTCLQKRH